MVKKKKKVGKEKKSMTETQLKKELKIFNEELLKFVTEFTNKNNILITDIRCNPDVEPIGQTGLVNIRYSITINGGTI